MAFDLSTLTGIGEAYRKHLALFAELSAGFVEFINSGTVFSLDLVDRTETSLRFRMFGRLYEIGHEFVFNANAPKGLSYVRCALIDEATGERIPRAKGGCVIIDHIGNIRLENDPRALEAPQDAATVFVTLVSV